jgi:hypothetical protein
MIGEIRNRTKFSLLKFEETLERTRRKDNIKIGVEKRCHLRGEG